MDAGKEQALVIGASGAIAASLAQRWAADPRFDRIWEVSRTPKSQVDPESPRVALATDHSEQQIQELTARILEQSPRLSRVVMTLGTLHGEHHQPEKSLDALSLEAMQSVYRINCVLPMLWLAALAPGLRRNPDCRIAVLSARVGSIGDNRLGGWYSYRSAKAALNMALKCAAIELARRAKGVKLIAFHPGTVDTPLSQPFQRGVPTDKLFTPAYVSQRLDEVLEAHHPDGELSYLDWAGETVVW